MHIVLFLLVVSAILFYVKVNYGKVIKQLSITDILGIPKIPLWFQAILPAAVFLSFLLTII